MGRNIKILYMDDELAMRENMIELGAALDYDFVCVGNGESAVESYRNAMDTGQPFDLVILDLTIKGSDMQGDDTMKALMGIDPDVKAIVFSGHSNKAIIANYKDYGFSGRLNKPVMIDNFCKVIDEVVNM